jgi:PAS domain S-box-containing protein
MIDHPFLLKQLAILGIESSGLQPTAESWQSFLKSVNQFYYQVDENRQLLERSLKLSSEEMQERWQALQESEIYKRSIFDTALDGIIITDHCGSIIDLNPAVEGIFATNKLFLMGKSISIIFPNNYEIESLPDNKNLSGHLYSLSFVRTEISGLSLKDKTNIPVEISCLPVTFSEIKAQLIYIWYIRDLRKQKEFEKIIEIQRGELVTSSKLAILGEMAGGIAHEVNTPLATIKFAVELMKENLSDTIPDTEFVINKLDLVDRTLERINTIIRNLRNFARDGSQDPMRRMSVREILEDTLSLCKERFKKHNIEIRVVFLENSEHYISCRAVQISQVLLNLISNSFDAVENLEKKWVQINVGRVISEGQSYVELAILDSGSGISEPVIKKMFDPFFTTKEIGRGTGMGLSISMGYLRDHGGDLYYDSKGKNTCFKIKLPEINK